MPSSVVHTTDEIHRADRREEEMLIAAAKSGDATAFEALVKCYQARIFLVAVRYTRVREDAEDVVQQTFQKAFVYLQRFQGRSSFATWLTRIAINEALMALRRDRALREVSLTLDDLSNDEGTSSGQDIADTRPDPETHYSRQEIARILLEALAQLGPGVRSVLELRELHELTARETAEQMGLSLAAVKARVFQGRRKLRNSLQLHMAPNRTIAAKAGRRALLRSV
jgi:RNA polymerase sigma-70 factor, ECF subfamily